MLADLCFGSAIYLAAWLGGWTWNGVVKPSRTPTAEHAGCLPMQRRRRSPLEFGYSDRQHSRCHLAESCLLGSNVDKFAKRFSRSHSCQDDWSFPMLPRQFWICEFERVHQKMHRGTNL